MRDKEREGTHTHSREGCHGRQTNKIVFLLSGDGEWHTNGPIVVGKYTQTRQRWLRAKIVKFGHGKHYKEAFAVYREEGRERYSIWNLKTKK